MIIYIDILILSTILVNYVFIKTISLIFNDKLSIIRTIIALFISVISLLLYLLPYKAYFIIRYFVGIIIGMVAFKDLDIKNKIIKIAIFYILNMSFIGTLVVFKITNLIPMVLSLLYIVILYIIQNYKETFNKLYFNVYINNNKYKGYLDSGNMCSYLSKPVVYINKKYFNNIYDFIGYQEINTIGTIIQIKVYSGPPLIINKKKYIVYYSFDDNLVYDVLLNNLMRGDLFD